jgi:hypothetical protein
MARLTASDMIDIVRDSLGGETTETLSDTRILRFINQSYLELASKYQYPQLSTSTTITTSSGTASYELTVTNVLSYNDLEDDTNNLKLYPMNEDQYRKFTQGNTQSGTPVYWFVDGVLVTSPAATSPVIREPWDDSIIHRAVSRGWRELGDLTAAGTWLALARQNDSAAMKSTYTPSYIQTRPGSYVGRALQDV